MNKFLVVDGRGEQLDDPRTLRRGDRLRPVILLYRVELGPDGGRLDGVPPVLLGAFFSPEEVNSFLERSDGQ